MSDVALSPPVPPGPPPAPPPAPPANPAWVDALVDRLNPILVREVRQAVNGKFFLITAGLALVATVLIGLVAAAGGGSVGRGAVVFVGTLEVLTPIVLFIVPLQAFLSTRHEVTRGTVEHLLLSRLTPGQIVRGKVAAATVQFVIYLGIFAPLIATTFLLRGIDVPTIAYTLSLALVFGVAASALAVACGALSRWPNVFRVLPFAVVLGGLGFFTVLLMVGVSEILFDLTDEFVRGNFWAITTAILLPSIAGIVLFALVGQAALAHPYANRSSGFRLFALVGLVGVFVWMGIVLYTFTRSGPSSVSATVLWQTSAVLAGMLVLFPLFASTEAPPLSPRVRTHVPGNPFLAALSVPFLPGAGRGFLFTLLFAALGIGLPALFATWGDFRAASERWVGVTLIAWGYVVLYCGLACFVRHRMKPTAKATWIARLLPVGVMLLSILLPLLVAVLLEDRISRWQPWQIFDPFTTIATHDGRPYEPWNILWAILFLALLFTTLNLIAVGDGIREVMTASRNRRRRADPMP